MEKLRKGSYIVITYIEKGKPDRKCNAKVVEHVTTTGRLNVFAQGRLMWINDSQYVEPGEKGAPLKRNEFIPSKPIAEPVIEPNPADVRELVEMGMTTTDAVQSLTTSILTDSDELYLSVLTKKKSQPMTIEQISDAAGKSTPATKLAIERLVSMGYVDLISSDAQDFALSIKGRKHVPGNAKPTKDIPKLKTDKETGEVKHSKKEMVLMLLKDPTMTVKAICEATGAASSYVRGIRERSAKKMETPEAGTLKRKVYDALLLGGSLTDVSAKCRVTISYAYQIRQQMMAAKIV